MIQVGVVWVLVVGELSARRPAPGGARVDYELLEEHAEGLIALSSGMSGAVARELLAGRQAFEAADAADAFEVRRIAVEDFPVASATRGTHSRPPLNASSLR